MGCLIRKLYVAYSAAVCTVSDFIGERLGDPSKPGVILRN